MPGLEDLYREIILDHYRNPRNEGELESPPALRAVGFNPLCGDEVVVSLELAEGIIRELRIGGQGCSISRSSASMMSVAATGKSIAEARGLIRTFKSLMSIHESRLDSEEGASGADEAPVVNLGSLGELAALQGVVKFPVRIKCATLAWNTLGQALDEAEAAVAEASAGDDGRLGAEASAGDEASAGPGGW